MVGIVPLCLDVFPKGKAMQCFQAAAPTRCYQFRTRAASVQHTQSFAPTYPFRIRAWKSAKNEEPFHRLQVLEVRQGPHQAVYSISLLHEARDHTLLVPSISAIIKSYCGCLQANRH